MSARDEVGFHAKQHARWHWGEFAFWIAVLGCAFAFPSRYLIMTDILRLALFALSLTIFVIDPGNVERPDQARARVAVSPNSVQVVIKW